MGYRLTENNDGTLTLHIPEGIRSTQALFPVVEAGGLSGIGIPESLRSCLGENPREILERVSVIGLPASMEFVTDQLYWRFPGLRAFCISPESEFLSLEDGVLFSKDKKKLIKYFDQEGCHSYRIPECVEQIASGCFYGVRQLERIDMGKNVKTIQNCGLWDDGQALLEKVYIPPTVTELVGEIFGSGGDDGGIYYPVRIVGGAPGSAIEEYCNERGIDFIAVDAQEVEAFYRASLETLDQRMLQQAENENYFLADDISKGYQAKFSDGVLEYFVPEGVSASQIPVKDTRIKINKNRRKKVKRLIIGPGITEIADMAFDDYPNLESVYIGPDVCRISPTAFSGSNGHGSWGCRKLAAIVVDEKNPWYRAVDHVLYTHDMQTLVKYSPAKPELYHAVDSQVRHIGAFAFEYADALQCLKVGTGCVSVGHAAFLNVQALRHAWFADSVSDWPEYFPFVEEWGFERPYRIRNLILGGASGSFVEKYCADAGAHFHVITGDQVQDFLATPLPDAEDDPYMARCRKVMIVDRNGILLQLGEYGRELILPEGVVRTHYRINLSGCTRVSLPATLNRLWAEGLDGPAKDLKEFSVARDNENYRSVEGHLYSTDGTLLVYAPAADGQGRLPVETVAIGKDAFRLLPRPFSKVYIPSGVRSIALGWSAWFYEAQVAGDNPYFKAIDGSVFSADGKILVCAKLSENGYRVPDGVEEIAAQALCGVQGTVHIPASVTVIRDVNGLGRHVTGICAPAGSFAEQYARQRHISLYIGPEETNFTKK